MYALPYETSCKGILGRPENMRRALSFTRPNAVTGKKRKKKRPYSRQTTGWCLLYDNLTTHVLHNRTNYQDFSDL